MHQPVKTPARAAGPSTTASTTPMPPKLASTTSWMPKNSPSATGRRQKVQWDPCPPAGTDAVHVRMWPGGTQQEDEADCHQQRRSSDDGVDPVAEGVGQFRQPVGQGVVVIYGKRLVQCDLYGVSILHYFRGIRLIQYRLTFSSLVRGCVVVGKCKTPRAMMGRITRMPDLLPCPVVLKCRIDDVPGRRIPSWPPPSAFRYSLRHGGLSHTAD